MPEWQQINGTVAVQEPPITEQLAGERAMVEWLEESIRELESLYMDDWGWQKLGWEADHEFSPEGRRQVAATSRIMAVANPLIKRGLTLRCGYIWGQGVQVSIKDDGAKGQNVNAVLEAFWDDPINKTVLTSPEAQFELERQLGTDGEIIFSFPTNPITGTVGVRSLPPEEFDKIICDPEDNQNAWLYRRRWTAVTEKPDGKIVSEQRVTYYPRLGYRPAVRAQQWGSAQDRGEIRWDAPVRHVAVNKVRAGAKQRGVGDVFAALPWARLDKEFLENWAIYMKAMTRILWQITAKGSQAAKVKRQMSAPPTATRGNPDGAGQAAIMDPNSKIEAVSKSGATIDAESHKPLASYVAAALGVPLTALLEDPGTTGARAVAETLREPTENEMDMRRKLWDGVIEDAVGYVIDSAVLAPGNRLRGTVARDGDRLVVTLPPGDQRDVDINWPDWESLSIETLMKAISLADSTEKMPPLVLIKLMLQAFEVEDIDEILASITDDEGNFIPQTVRDEETSQRAADRGDAGTTPPDLPEE